MKQKKSLGQNFLKSKQIIEDIVKTANVAASDLVLEIGPGEGVLTEVLLRSSAKIICVEKDRRLIPILKEKFGKYIESEKLEVIEGDILEVQVEKIIPADLKYKIVANIPYYITGQILRKFLEGKFKPQSITLLVQDEVAKRITTKGKENLLSLSVKAYGQAKYIKKVSRSLFKPQPKVDSAIIHIEDISSKLGNIEKKFFEIIHLGFQHKRKQLLPNLDKKYHREKVLEAFLRLEIPLKTRAEDVSFETWIKLCSIL